MTCMIHRFSWVRSSSVSSFLSCQSKRMTEKGLTQPELEAADPVHWPAEEKIRTEPRSLGENTLQLR